MANGWIPEHTSNGNLRVSQQTAFLTLGCYHQPLKHAGYFSCLANSSPNTLSSVPMTKRQVRFIGDSSVRQLFFSVVRLVDGGKDAVPAEWISDGEKHTDRRLTFYDQAGTSAERALEIEFWW